MDASGCPVRPLAFSLCVLAVTRGTENQGSQPSPFTANPACVVPTAHYHGDPLPTACGPLLTGCPPRVL
jgi:hypothetical protein